jgi:muramoyltetrapeptide carboxypeptidase
VIQTILPPALRPDATIGIVAPARWPGEDMLDRGRAWLERLGFKVKIHPHTAARDGRLAGDDTTRAAALNAMFADPAVDAILCARGGTGSFRLLDAIDFASIRHQPKIFCGFSDITTLLNAITQRTGLVTFHGPLLWNFARDGNDIRTGLDWLELLMGNFPQTGKTYPTQCLTPGYAEGKLVGGNLSLLRDMIGTPDDWHSQDRILFFEDIDEPLYKTDHTLWQLRQAGKFVGVRGVIVGVFTPHADDGNPSTDPNDPPYGKPLVELLRTYLPPGIPVGMNFPCGHAPYLTTLPVGVKVAMQVAADHTHLRLLEPATR